MPSRSFHKNKVLESMEITGDRLRITFKKGQIRVYSGVPVSVAYGLFYKTNATEELRYYSTEIKGKYEVIEVINKK